MPKKKDTHYPGILKEESILQSYKNDNEQEQTLKLRRIAWWYEKHKVPYELITNNFLLEATVIVQLYRYRWQIGFFSKS